VARREIHASLEVKQVLYDVVRVLQKALWFPEIEARRTLVALEKFGRFHSGVE